MGRGGGLMGSMGVLYFLRGLLLFWGVGVRWGRGGGFVCELVGGWQGRDTGTLCGESRGGIEVCVQTCGRWPNDIEAGCISAIEEELHSQQKPRRGLRPISEVKSEIQVDATKRALFDAASSLHPRHWYHAEELRLDT